MEKNEDNTKPKHIRATCQTCKSPQTICLQVMDQEGKIRNYCFPCLEEHDNAYWRGDLML